MKLIEALEEHDEALRQFFGQFLMSGPVAIKLERPQSFFAPYRIQSPRYKTFILEDRAHELDAHLRLTEPPLVGDGGKTHEILGCVSFVIDDVVLQGKRQTVAFARDLRIAQNRKAIRGWSELLSPVFEEMRRTHHVDYFFSTLNMAETKALNTFVRPRQIRRQLPRYHLYQKFSLVTVHGRWPWINNPLPHLKIQPAGQNREEELMYYMLQKTLDLDLLPWFDRTSIQSHLDLWQGPKLKDFLIAVDREENIVGCLAPWKNQQIQSYIPYEYDLRAHNFRQFLKFGKLMGWTRPLTKPVKRLAQPAPLDFSFLSFVLVEHPDIFEALLEAAFEHCGPSDFLVYLQMKNQIHLRPPLGWITAQIPHGLYCLIPEDFAVPDFLAPDREEGVYLEPLFV